MTAESPHSDPRVVSFSWSGTMACGLLAVLITGALYLGTMRLGDRTVLTKELQNAGHVLGFGVLAVVAVDALRRLVPRWSTKRLFGSVLLLAVFLGVGIELLQVIVPSREFSLRDLYRDVLGTLAGLCLAASWRSGAAVAGRSRPRTSRRLSQSRQPDLCAAAAAARGGGEDSNEPLALGHVRRVRCQWIAMGTACAVLGCWTLIFSAWDYRRRAVEFPTLLDARSTWWQRFVSPGSTPWSVVDAPATWPPHTDRQVVEMRYLPIERYPSFSMREVYGDWRAFGQLYLDVASSEDEPFEVVLRVHDKGHDGAFHDRFNRTFTIRPGFQRLRIPLAEIRDGPRGRQLDLAHVAAFSLFALEPRRAITVYVDNIRLE